jgi:Holliday junction resolvasome RuvABC endonuclease subunit
MSTILGIDPGTKEMGIAVIRGPELLASGVHTLRNGHRPHDVIGQAKALVLSYVEEYEPSVVGIEKPLLRPTKRASLMSVIGQELRARSRDLGLRVVEISAREVRRVLVGDAFAKKLDVARVIVERHFPELRERLPRKPKRAALGFSYRDKYWLHMFDAIAVALASAEHLAETAVAPR